MQVSVHKPASTIFFRPIFSIAATKFLSSHEFIEDRSMGSRSGKTALSCGHMFPLKLFVSTVVNTTGTSKMRVALASATVLLMIDCRSKLEVPNNICGWWSMNATAQLSGVSRPFSLRFICCVCAIRLFLSDPKLLPPLSSFEVHTDASVVPIPFFLRFTKPAPDANLRGQCAMNGAVAHTPQERDRRPFVGANT